MMLKTAKDLEIGDVVVLEGDPYVDFVAEPFATVVEVWVETDFKEDVTVATFSNRAVIAFPNKHRVIIKD
jgi:hypothetical protein